MKKKAQVTHMTSNLMHSTSLLNFLELWGNKGLHPQLEHLF